MNINETFDYETLVRLIVDLTELMKQYPKCKYYIMKQYGLSIFIDIIDTYLENLNTMVLHAALQLINQMIDGDSKLLEHSYLFGILPYMLKFSNCEYPKDIRVEAAYFIGQMFYSNKSSLEILIASGGFGALNEFLDVNYKDNKDLICLSIDCLVIIFEMKTLSVLNICKILSKFNIIQRLLLIIDQINSDEEDPNMLKYLVKALELILNFAKCDDKKIKLLLCESEILHFFKIFLSVFQNKQAIQSIVIKIFRFISFEPMTLNSLENLGLIPISLSLLAAFLPTCNEEPLLDLLKILFYMSKLNNARQEQVALHQGVPLILRLCKLKITSLTKISLQILCFMVQTSYLTREKLWEAGGPRIFIEHFDDKLNVSSLLDTIASWLELDNEKVENILIESQTLSKLIEIFRNADKVIFQQIVPLFLKFISLSEKLAFKLGKSPEFLQELVERLGIESLENEEKETVGEYSKFIKNSGHLNKKPIRNECSNPSALIRKEILDILFNLCVRHSNPRSLLNKNDLYPIIVQILHIAQDGDMVILVERATQLMQIYSEPLK